MQNAAQLKSAYPFSWAENRACSTKYLLGLVPARLSDHTAGTADFYSPSLTDDSITLPFYIVPSYSVESTHLIVEVVRVRVHEEDRAVGRGEGEYDLHTRRAHVGVQDEALGHQAAQRVANDNHGVGCCHLIGQRRFFKIHKFSCCKTDPKENQCVLQPRNVHYI